MTTLIAFPIQDGTVLCADKRITDGNSSRILSDDVSKIIYAETTGRKFAIAAAGSWGAICVVQSLLKEHAESMPKPITIAEATKFAMWLHQLLLDNDLRPDTHPENKDYTVGGLPCSFLIATPLTAITITTGMDVFSSVRAAVGSGANCALGAMEVMNPPGSKPLDFAGTIFGAVAKYDLDTSPTFNYIAIQS